MGLRGYQNSSGRQVYEFTNDNANTTLQGKYAGIGEKLMNRAEINPQYEADKAATSVQSKADTALGSSNRRLAAMGIDPSAGRATSENRNAAIALAAAKAGAANKARRGAVNDSWNRMTQAANLMQTDRSQNFAEQSGTAPTFGMLGTQEQNAKREETRAKASFFRKKATPIMGLVKRRSFL